MAKVLIVDDEERLVEMVRDFLANDNHIVESAENGYDGLNLMRSFGFDLIILDWNMPGITGPDLCKRFRDSGGTAPVLMLTANSAIEDKERGFNCGADDYLTKPFHLKELSLRVRALLARAPAPAMRNELNMGSLRIDLLSAETFVGKNKIALTAKEFTLLEYMMRHQEQVFSVDVLLRNVWQSDAEVSTTGVRMCVKRLREKLKAATASPSIETVTGFGYRLCLENDNAPAER